MCQRGLHLFPQYGRCSGGGGVNARVTGRCQDMTKRTCSERQSSGAGRGGDVARLKVAAAVFARHV